MSLTYTEKVFQHISKHIHDFHDWKKQKQKKKISKLRIEENFLNLIKGIYGKTKS